ncbi:hypothetical protein [uncultured Winogradskyella sp.]|uniref:hypothetical protein n=1 Tax=uncultured Winogradskyella sp. TaxID=395353 RepID=UPI0026254DB7|nr:hypothetical protein [uncultured Winogradskyella sp.]
MNNKLLIKAFEKAKEEINTDSVAPRAQKLSDFILEDSKEPYGAKILRIKFNSIKLDPETSITLKDHAKNSLSHYLGYNDFLEFSHKNQDPNSNDKSVSNKSTAHYKIIIACLVITLLIVSIYQYTNRQRWMIWEGTRYVEVNFDLKTYEVNKLKIYKQDRIDFFEKIVPKCEDVFFKKNGDVILWYGKNAEKEIEYFTALGLHPETGKSLKPITQYMIDTHICN